MTSSNIRLRFCSFLLVSVITLGLLLGSSVVAYADDIVMINGIQCKAVELTNSNIKAIFDRGDASASLILGSSNTSNISLFDMVNQTSSVVTIDSSGTQYELTDCDYLDLGNSTYLNFSNAYSYNMRVNSSSTITSYFQIVLPFPYILSDYSVYVRYNYSGISNDQNTQLGFHINNEDSTSNHYYLNTTRKYYYWNQTSFIKKWQSKYNWIPNGYSLNNVENEGIRTAYSEGTITNISSNGLVDFIRLSSSSTIAHADGTGWQYFFAAPMLVTVDFSGTVYVPIEYQEQVLEYLDLITGDPTAANQQRIDELTNDFQQKQQDLSDLTEDLTVTVPDISGTIGSIPEDAQEGVNDFATYIFNPLFNINTVSLLIGCAFGFAILKLVLFGSGSS